MSAVCIIPARGGSKRIPGKNIRDFQGKPMIAWSIETARESGVFDDIVVSTDSEEIAKVCKNYGANVPFTRPAELSSDDAPMIPVVQHAIDELKKLHSQPEFVCCLHATAPFVTPDSLKEGHELLVKNPQNEMAVSVTSFPYPIFRALRLDSDLAISMFWPENEFVRSQDLDEGFHDAGQFYWGRREAFEKSASVLSSRSVGVVIPRHRVQDIDSEEDWQRAELMFRAMKSK